MSYFANQAVAIEIDEEFEEVLLAAISESDDSDASGDSIEDDASNAMMLPHVKAAFEKWCKKLGLPKGGEPGASLMYTGTPNEFAEDGTSFTEEDCFLYGFGGLGVLSMFCPSVRSKEKPVKIPSKAFRKHANIHCWVTCSG